MDKNQYKNIEEKSILGYEMINQSVYDDIIEIKIDEETLYSLTKYNRKEIKETDHNRIIVEISGIRQTQKKGKKSYGIQKQKRMENIQRNNRYIMQIQMKYGKEMI